MLWVRSHPSALEKVRSFEWKRCIFNLYSVHSVKNTANKTTLNIKVYEKKGRAKNLQCNIGAHFTPGSAFFAFAPSQILVTECPWLPDKLIVLLETYTSAQNTRAEIVKRVIALSLVIFNFEYVAAKFLYFLSRKVENTQTFFPSGTFLVVLWSKTSMK